MGLSCITADGEQRGVALLRLGRVILLRDCPKKTGCFMFISKK